MKIIALQAENIKKLVAIEIRPDGNMVEITGKNGQGKTSVLDSIWWALAGTSNIQEVPIRKGATQARIRLDLGTIVVTRTFKDGEKGQTSSITVENVEGARFPSPQVMLDGLWDSLTFDPLAFSRMTPDKQFQTLRKFVPGVDFEAIEEKNRIDYARRTDVNRRLKEAQALANSFIIPNDTPNAPINENELIEKVASVGKHNADIEIRKAKRVAVAQETANLQGRMQDLLDQASNIKHQITLNQERLRSAPDLPDPINTDELQKELMEARAKNKNIEIRKKRDEIHEQIASLDKESKTLTHTMEKRTLDKQAAIAAAKLPVQGIGFGDGIIMLNGVPFNQASDAEQLRTSIALAMASNPELKVLRVRDGSLLDEDSMKLLAAMAEEHDFQVWIETVNSSGRVGFVLEDGHLKQAVQP